MFFFCKPGDLDLSWNAIDCESRTQHIFEVSLDSLQIFDIFWFSTSLSRQSTILKSWSQACHSVETPKLSVLLNVKTRNLSRQVSSILKDGFPARSDWRSGPAPRLRHDQTFVVRRIGKEGFDLFLSDRLVDLQKVVKNKMSRLRRPIDKCYDKPGANI